MRCLGRWRRGGKRQMTWPPRCTPRCMGRCMGGVSYITHMPHMVIYLTCRVWQVRLLSLTCLIRQLRLRSHLPLALWQLRLRSHLRLALYGSTNMSTIPGLIDEEPRFAALLDGDAIGHHTCNNFLLSLMTICVALMAWLVTLMTLLIALMTNDNRFPWANGNVGAHAIRQP